MFLLWTLSSLNYDTSIVAKGDIVQNLDQTEKSVDPDETACNAPSHLDLIRLHKNSV